MIEVTVRDASVLKSYGFVAVIELDIYVHDHERGRSYYFRIPKVVEFGKELEWRYPELFGVRGSPELTKKSEG